MAIAPFHGAGGSWMAGIKSTLELAMERSGKIGISEKDKMEIRHREIAQKVNGLSHRYLEGVLTLNEILKEIQKMEENAAQTAREALLSRWIESLSFEEDDDRLLKGIEVLRGRNAADPSSRRGGSRFPGDTLPLAGSLLP